MRGHVVLKGGDEVLASGHFGVRGELRGGLAYCTYTVDDRSRDKRWDGVCVLSIPSFGDQITGVWLTEDMQEKGALAYGTLCFSR